MNYLKPYVLTLLLILCLPIAANACETFVNFEKGDLLLNEKQHISIHLSSQEPKGVDIAARNLCTDINKVCGANVSITDNTDAKIIIGTIGHSAIIDRFIDKKLLKGKREKFIIKTQGDKLLIAGSDRRGTIYGIYELSRQIGVSPWYYWADVPVKKHQHIYIKKGVYTDGEPVVRYRGLFLNDEAPCLTTWIANTFKTPYAGHEFYAKVFELILRLKGNFMWPAMWGYAFYADDPENHKTADEMGIIMGTSHHEPMARNHQEWARSRGKNGAWNYQTNQKVLDKFFREGIERVKGAEDVITIGMRGDGDEAMSAEADTRLLERIVDNQRKIIADVTGRPAKETPQVWALYKEVLDYYDKGMRVPDDVTIMLCDDNWGNIRRVPTAKERRHPGGWGLYYHVDYVGAPRNSKWLNVTPTQNMWEQLSLAYQYGLDRVWILNVGDLKPMEYPIDLFMDMAWNPTRYNASSLLNHTLDFCTRAFGADQAQEAARILNLQGKYSGRITAEMLDSKTYNLHSGEWEKVADDYMRLETEALRQFITLQPEYHDAYRELILFPVQAVSNIYQMYYAQAMNHELYRQGNPECNEWADRVQEAFKRDSILCREYNKNIANGKWDGMMIQKHIGYKNWNDDFPHDMLPETFRLEHKQLGGFCFNDSTKYVVMEAEHFHHAQNTTKGTWTVIPFMGRTLSGISLQPYTVSTKGASLTYLFKMSDENVENVDIHIITKSTLDFLNKGGLRFSVQLDDQQPIVVNMNGNLNEKPENIYSIYYPTIARRVIESKVRVPWQHHEGHHTLTIQPLDPGIVFEKIVVNGQGYQPQYLFGTETPHTIK